jgi:protein-disulfide isomerase
MPPLTTVGHSAAPSTVQNSGPPELSPTSLASKFDVTAYAHFDEGNGPVHLAVFFDPNCSFCNYIWHEVHSIPDYKNRFTISWIPLGMLQPTSAGESAAILRSGGISGLNFDESNFDLAHERGGIIPSSDQSSLKKVNANNAAWATLISHNGLQLATPTIVINDHQIIVGAPPVSQLRALEQPDHH